MLHDTVIGQILEATQNFQDDGLQGCPDSRTLVVELFPGLTLQRRASPVAQEKSGRGDGHDDEPAKNQRRTHSTAH